VEGEGLPDPEHEGEGQDGKGVLARRGEGRAVNGTDRFRDARPEYKHKYDYPNAEYHEAALEGGGLALAGRQDGLGA
jgi:hypothetical protein